MIYRYHVCHCQSFPLQSVTFSACLETILIWLLLLCLGTSFVLYAVLVCLSCIYCKAIFLHFALTVSLPTTVHRETTHCRVAMSEFHIMQGKHGNYSCILPGMSPCRDLSVRKQLTVLFMITQTGRHGKHCTCTQILVSPLEELSGMTQQAGLPGILSGKLLPRTPAELAFCHAVWALLWICP